jgi:cyclic pyranopterin phosphate synthase
MIDVSHKTNSLRTAIAEARIVMKPETLLLTRDGKLPKGDALTVAKVAAIQGCKNTAQLIPYCHPIPLDFVGVNFTFGNDHLVIQVEVKTVWKTGVEVEAITGASIGALAIYDMTKMIDDSVVIENIHLVSKKGGKTDLHIDHEKTLRAAVLVLSDSVSSGTATDLSGKVIEERLLAHGFEILDFSVIPDEKDLITEKLHSYADDKVDLVLTTGGTGLGPRDTTPEATMEFIDYEIPGITELLRHYGQQRTPFAMLSRGIAGKRGKTLVINLPGSQRAVVESLDALFPQLKHAFKMMDGEGH